MALEKMVFDTLCALFYLKLYLITPFQAQYLITVGHYGPSENELFIHANLP